MPVEQHIRNRNHFMVQERRRWREIYAILSTEIKDLKNVMSEMNAEGDFASARSAKIILNILRREAQRMMHEREMIAIQLKASAYRYE